MLTGKQRSYLKSLANPLKPITQLGKEGVTQAFLEQVDHLLNDHELIKISVLESSPMDAETAALEIVNALNAEYVQAIGKKFTLYRESRTAPLLEIPGADHTRIKNYKKKIENNGKKEVRVSKKGGRISKPTQGRRAAGRRKAAEAAGESKITRGQRRDKRDKK